MDPRTKATLGRITRNIPNRLLDITKLVVDSSEEEIAHAALASPDISLKRKREIKKLLDQGAFRREEVVVDEKKVAELDKYHTREVAKARAAGMLEDPKKDLWLQKRLKRIREKNKINKK